MKSHPASARTAPRLPARGARRLLLALAAGALALSPAAGSSAPRDPLREPRALAPAPGGPSPLGAETACFGQPVVVPAGFLDTLVVGGLDLPTGIAFLPDGRLLVVEQMSGKIRVVANGAIAAPDPALVVPLVNADWGERGLLGIAVDPQWPSRPYVYVHYTHTSGKVRVSRFLAYGDLTGTGDGQLYFQALARYDILTDLPDSHGGHNGGSLRFGPDGKLYVSLGDDFTFCAAQDTVTLRGVVLRIDVAGLPGGFGGPPAKSAITPADNPFVTHSNVNARLVWAQGLRNPFRIQVDAEDGRLAIGDVGHGVNEELDVTAVGGLNFGWPFYEGDQLFGTCGGVGDTVLTPPTSVYPHVTGEGAAIVVAPFYRAPTGATWDWPAAYDGDLFFSDYYLGFLRRLHWNGSAWQVAAPVGGQPAADRWGTGFCEVTDYAIAPDGDLWYCRQAVDFAPASGQIRRIRATATLDVESDRARDAVRFDAPWPVPAASGTNLRWSQPYASRVDLTVLDVSGRRVAQLAATTLPAGTHVVRWNGTDPAGRRVPAGLYFARLVVDGRAFRRRLVLVH